MCACVCTYTHRSNDLRDWGNGGDTSLLGAVILELRALFRLVACMSCDLCVCVTERARESARQRASERASERERERESERARERGRDREYFINSVY